jgi:hypothetical protein
VDVAKRVVDTYNRRDVDGLFAELATPNFEWYPAIVRGLDGGGGLRGRAGVDRFAADTSENWAELQIIAAAESSTRVDRLAGTGMSSVGAHRSGRDAHEERF